MSGTAITRRDRRTRSEGGSASVELVLIMPVLMVLFLLLAQWAVREQGQRAVNAAAREGAVAAAAWEASADAGHDSVTATLDTSGVDLDGVAVTTDRSATSATVTVSADVPSLLPGVDITVSSTQSAPLEVFVP
jgi:Flp pilus assembly protein TadG